MTSRTQPRRPPVGVIAFVAAALLSLAFIVVVLATAGGPEERVRVVAGASSCAPAPALGGAHFVVTLRNDAADEAEVQVLPVRYYSDGTSNDSDALTFTVPAASTRTFEAMVPVDVARHLLVGCEAFVNDTSVALPFQAG